MSTDFKEESRIERIKEELDKGKIVKFDGTGYLPTLYKDEDGFYK